MAPPLPVCVSYPVCDPCLDRPLRVSQVVDIMRTNVEKVLERDQKLSELDDRAGQPTAARVALPLYLSPSLPVCLCLSVPDP